ncbi:hypothetical protein Gotur_027516, partial [Gossypium turneri]
MAKDRIENLLMNPPVSEGYGNKFSSPIVKRLILRMDQQNRLISSANDSNQNPVFGHNNNLYSQMIAAGFAVI